MFIKKPKGTLGIQMSGFGWTDGCGFLFIKPEKYHSNDSTNDGKDNVNPTGPGYGFR